MIGMFTDGRYPIVTGGAVIYDASMIKHRGGERRGPMAVGAIPGCGYMVIRLTNGHQAVVTGCAVIHDTGMIKHPGGKATSLVTDTAILGGGNMIHWFADG